MRQRLLTPAPGPDIGRPCDRSPVRPRPDLSGQEMQNSLPSGSASVTQALRALLAVPQPGGAEGDQALDLDLAAGGVEAALEVEVDAVLDRLGLGHVLEQQPRADAGRVP